MNFYIMNQLIKLILFTITKDIKTEQVVGKVMLKCKYRYTVCALLAFYPSWDCSFFVHTTVVALMHDRDWLDNTCRSNSI